MAEKIVKALEDHESLGFFFTWVLANTGALLVGRWFSGLIVSVLWPAPITLPNTHITRIVENPIGEVIIVGIVTGFLVGLFELQVLRWYGCYLNWKWVASNMLACLVFPILAGFAFLSQQSDMTFFVWILGGVALGITQWQILRKILHRAGWWVLTMAVTGPFLLASITPIPFSDSYVFVAIFVGVVTGLVMVSLLKRPIEQSISE